MDNRVITCDKRIREEIHLLRHEEIVKKFSWGISVLTAYLHYNNKINYTDINILSEGFVRDLLNILLNLKVSIAKNKILQDTI